MPATIAIKSQGVSEVFENLSSEIYYGFNMRMELTTLKSENPKQYEAICNFIETCRKARG
jgi:hypothetical protein